jgi:hypothetical protein
MANLVALTSRPQVSLRVVLGCEPSTYYENRSKLCVAPGFREDIVEKAKPVRLGTVFKINSYDLSADLTDTDIERALGGNPWEESILCAVLAEMITRQPGIFEGELLISGKINLFYTPSCVVVVTWSSALREWFIITTERNHSIRLVRSTRVFTPND